MADEAFIRSYRPGADDAAVIHIFRETCDASLKIEPTWTIGSYIWARPYILLSPETCFVIDDGTGQAVGYILGTTDTTRFAQKWRNEYLPSLDASKVPSAPADDPKGRAAALLDILWRHPEKGLNHFDGLWEEFPAHLHIDILSSHQNRGLGPKLMETLFQALRDRGCSGLHLGLSVTNQGALKFYQRVGFKRFDRVLDGGASGERGQSGGAIIMTMKL